MHEHHLKLATLVQLKHDLGLYPLLSILLTVPPFVERFQQRDDPCVRWFLRLSLSFLLYSDPISELYIQLLPGFQT